MLPLQVSSIAAVMLLMAFGFSTSAQAQNAREATLVGQPLIYAKEGKLTGCGIRVLAMDEAPKAGVAVLLIDSSIQLNMNVAGMMVKFVASRAAMVNGEPVVRSRPVVERAWFRADGLTPTSARDGLMMPTSEPPGGVLYVTTSLKNDMSILLAMLNGKTVEMGAKLQGESGDTVRFGKVVLSEAEAGRVQSCLDDLLASAKAEPGK
jgi:hypothetical protein